MNWNTLKECVGEEGKYPLTVFHFLSLIGPNLLHEVLTPLNVLDGPFRQLLGKPDPTRQGTA